MKMIKKDGWQFWVEIYDDYVIKTPKKKELEQLVAKLEKDVV